MFQYFIADGTEATARQDIQDNGLSYAFERSALRGGAGLTVVGCVSGPEGRRGVTVSRAESGVGYYPDRQTWMRMVSCDRVWLGWSEMPGPKELARPFQLHGKYVELLDENQWLFPMTRRWVLDKNSLRCVCQLPTVITIDANGEWITDGVIPKYAALWDASCDFASKWVDVFIPPADAIADTDSASLTIRLDPYAVTELAVHALRANYYVDRHEFGILRVLANAEEVIDKVAKTVIDWEGFLALMEKKTQLDVQNTGGGPADSTPITDQQ